MTVETALTSVEAANHALIWLLRRRSTTECTGVLLKFCGYRADRVPQSPADTCTCCKAASPCARPTCVAEEASDPCVPRAPLARLRCGRRAEAIPFRWCTMSRNLQGTNRQYAVRQHSQQGKGLGRSIPHSSGRLIRLGLWSAAWRPHRLTLPQEVQQLRHLDKEGCRVK